MTIITEALKYSAAGDELHGHLAYDDAISGERPGVLIIHEWWGLNDYMRERAAQIAGLGYAALALDMYGEGKVGSSADEAGALMTTVLNDMDTGTARLQAGFDALAGHSLVDKARIGSIGYCFGGFVSWISSCQLSHVSAAVCYYGGGIVTRLDTPPRCPVMMHFGALDSMIPLSDIDKIRAAQAGVDINIYDSAEHGVNCDHRSSYQKKAASTALDRTLTFLSSHIG